MSQLVWSDTFNTRFITQLFWALLTTENEDFERSIKNIKYDWLGGDAKCTVTFIMQKANTFYKNLTGKKS